MPGVSSPPPPSVSVILVPQHVDISRDCAEDIVLGVVRIDRHASAVFPPRARILLFGFVLGFVPDLFRGVCDLGGARRVHGYVARKPSSLRARLGGVDVGGPDDSLGHDVPVYGRVP